MSPIVLMGLGWVGPVILYALNLSPFYLVRFRPETWWIILGTLLLFDVGCLIAIRDLPRCERRNAQLATIDVDSIRSEYVLYAYFALGLMAWLYKIWALGGVSAIVLLSDEPDVVRWQQLPKVVGQMPIFLLVVPLLCFVRWEHKGFAQRKSLWLLFALSVGTLILDTARSNIYQAVFIGILFWKCRRGKVPTKSIGAIAAVALLLFIVISAQRFSAAGNSAERMIDDVGILRPLAVPYIYLTTSLANLQLNFDHGRQTFDGGGVRTFMPILSWLQIYKPDQNGNYISDWPGGISLYQADFWIDFGWAGLIMGPFAFGLICGWAYRRWRIERTSLRAMVYAVIGTAVFASGFVNWFNSPVTWFLLILIPTALWLSRPPAHSFQYSERRVAV